jgi:hypothetical protein
MRLGRIGAILALAAALVSTAALPCNAAFTVAPTFDLTTSSNCAGATGAVYAFHTQSTDALEMAIGGSLTIPAGYSINPAYLTTTPGIVVFTGVYGYVGNPPVGTVQVTTTITAGTFAFYGDGVLKGAAMIVPPTSTTPGTAGGAFVALEPLQYADISTVPGFFLNPSVPGVYTWGPNTAIASDLSSVLMSPRPGFTNEVRIDSCVPVPVGGVVEPVIGITLLPQWLVAIGLLAVASALLVVLVRSRQVRSGHHQPRACSMSFAATFSVLVS